MSIFEIIILDIIFILFPFCLYVIYEIYNKTFDIRKDNLILEFLLISSFYLILKYKTALEIPTIIIICIPLIISYIKKRNFGILLLSIFLIIYYNWLYNVPIVILLIEFSVYFLLYLFYKKGKINSFIFANLVILIKSFSLYIYNTNKINIIVNDNDFILVVIIVIIFLNILLIAIKQLESMISFQWIYKELQKEKNLRMSLFKITHEIKNPITVCKGYLDMFDVDDPKKSKKYVSILQNEIKRVLILLEDFLSLNKIKIEKDIMDLNLLLSETIDNFNILLREKNIKKEINISEDELYINADYNRLSQVIINIIKNSIEAIDRNGKIKIYTKQKDNKVKIYIEDNGKGMNEEELKKLKQIFFTTKNNGTGLGVYLSNEIIKAHNGTINYSSKKNQGTKVTITLPYKKINII